MNPLSAAGPAPEARDLRSHAVDAPLVSVVVPSRNGRERLPTLLAALRAQTLGPEKYEVIIVDDASDDGTPEWLLGQEGIRVIPNKQNVGQGAANNQGVAAARAPLVAITDDDTIPARTWLEEGLRQFSSVEVAFLGGRVRLDVGPGSSPAALLDYGMGYLDQAAYVQSGFAATANFWCRRDAFQTLGGFVETFAWQCHDVEFGQRIRDAGLQLRYAEAVEVVHPPRSEVRSLIRRQYRMGRSADELRKYGVQGFSDSRPLWAKWQYYRPWRSVWGMARIRDVDCRIGRVLVLRLWFMQCFVLQLPLALGSLREAFSRTSQRAGC